MEAAVILHNMHQAVDEGVRAAATRLDHMRWTAMAAMVAELEDEMAAADDTSSVKA